jgi:hypothetical protein
LRYLEGKVAELKQQDANKQMQVLWKERDKIAAERDVLAQTLRSIERAIRANKKVLPAKGDVRRCPTESRDEHLQQEHENVLGDEIPPQELNSSIFISTSDPSEQTLHDEPVTYPTTAQDGDSGSLHELDLINAIPNPVFTIETAGPSEPNLEWSEEVELVNYEGALVQCQDVIAPTPISTCECLPEPVPNPRRLSLWRFANEVLSEPADWSTNISMREDALEDDTPVRAMVEGWDAVERRAGGHLPPSWSKLRRIDETIFHTCAKTERLAILKVMHSLFRYHQEPSPDRRKSMPDWYLAR